MTIWDKFIKSENTNFENLSHSDEIINNIGLTKEQILHNYLKVIAKEYLALEELKNSFVKIVLKNMDDLDFSQFIDFPKFYIKEGFLKKNCSICKY